MQTNFAGVVPARMTYSVPDAARVLGIGRNTAYEAVRRGDIRSIRVGGRVLVPKPELERLIGAGLTIAEAA